MNILSIVIAFFILLIAFLSFLYGINRNNQNKRDEFRVEHDKKISRVYGRIDEVKEGVKKEFVLLPVCEERQKRIDRMERSIEEIKKTGAETRDYLKQILAKLPNEIG